ncbi:hypothetical protein OCOJLMKI_4566 [Methylobacterium iners]|uniref:Uncharacterized protein n=1 Tax=Methylobacterium iners TaxID=418707 RepID=A0ABQ4S5B3_9HYPH|nr:hypothetical protein OCOJLMKI_4566 [Methylobacterium iners]
MNVAAGERVQVSIPCVTFTFANRSMPAYAGEEYAEVDLWGVVRFNIRWHVARRARGAIARG